MVRRFLHFVDPSVKQSRTAPGSSQPPCLLMRPLPLAAQSLVLPSFTSENRAQARWHVTFNADKR